MICDRPASERGGRFVFSGLPVRCVGAAQKNSRGSSRSPAAVKGNHPFRTVNPNLKMKKPRCGIGPQSCGVVAKHVPEWQVKSKGRFRPVASGGAIEAQPTEQPSARGWLRAAPAKSRVFFSVSAETRRQGDKRKKRSANRSLFLVELPGFEPGITGPESVVLPLHHSSMTFW